VQQLTPICDEQLWIQNFDVVNEIFTTLPVVVTLVVMFFHYREVDFASKMVKILKARFITSLKKEEQVMTPTTATAITTTTTTTISGPTSSLRR